MRLIHFFLLLATGIFVSPALVSVFERPLIAASPKDETANTSRRRRRFFSWLCNGFKTIMPHCIITTCSGINHTICLYWPCGKTQIQVSIFWYQQFLFIIACLVCLFWCYYAGSSSSVAGKDIAAVAILNFGLYILFSFTCFFFGRLPYPKSVIGRLKWLEKLQYNR